MTPEQPKPAAPEPSEREALMYRLVNSILIRWGMDDAYVIGEVCEDMRAALSVHQVGAPEPAVVEPTRAALAELVALKDLKDKCENAGAYSGRQDDLSEFWRRTPIAWANARAALAAVTGSEGQS